MVWAFGPDNAAPVSTSPKIGPAHGAHNKPVATPSKTAESKPLSLLPDGSRRLPNATNGRASKSARCRDNKVAANAVSNTKANQRPY